MGNFSRRQLNIISFVVTQLVLFVVLCLVTRVVVKADDEATTTQTPASANATASDGPVKLGVFMESLCPDTRRFFQNQLAPTQQLIGNIIDLHVVPFGHARLVGNNKMICQHGARECEGNRRMACILARTKNQTQIVETFTCLLARDSSAKDCVTKEAPEISFDELEKCTAGDESYQLMAAAEKETGKLEYVPHLTVNGKHTEEIQDQAEHHLKDLVCQLYTSTKKPEPCKSSEPSLE